MAEGKKLYRSKNDRWLAGVCGGIADYFGVDSTLIRVLFILFGFAVGGGIIIYIILWLVIPEPPEDGLAEEVDMPPEVEAVIDEISDEAESSADEE